MIRQNLVAPPKANVLQQGYLPDGISLPDEQRKSAIGVIITAECDLKHSKAPFVNLVPAIPLTTWLEVDGAEVILERAESDLRETLITWLKKKDLDPVVLSVASAETVVRAHEPQVRDSDKTLIKAKLFDSLIMRNWPDVPGSTYRFCRENFGAIAKRVLGELCENKVAGAHLFESLNPLQPDVPYVCLLRQIYHVEAAAVAWILRGGIDRNAIGAFGLFSQLVDQTSDSPIQFVGRVLPPFREHFLQRLSSTFTRIGVPDLTDVASAHILSHAQL
jgi:hypothetical protein